MGTVLAGGRTRKVNVKKTGTGLHFIAERDPISDVLRPVGRTGREPFRTRVFTRHSKEVIDLGLTVEKGPARKKTVLIVTLVIEDLLTLSTSDGEEALLTQSVQSFPPIEVGQV